MGRDLRGRTGDEEQARLAAGLGAELRRLRHAHGLTQQRLGDLAGIGRWHVSHLELGKRRPSVDALAALARVLGSPLAHEGLLDHLADLTGDSLRATVPRKRRRPTNKHRLQAVAQLEQQTAWARLEVQRREGIGIPVPEHLRKLADGTALENARAVLAFDSRSASRPLTSTNTRRDATVSTPERRHTP
ncbi:helix-turn-helix transcriptional regulator [Sinomonas sp. P10A9]|uniref:Helix-turn-helix transcriptional regulator n=1 Tax=Sinomonas puerhi TaxID=3238584 RepID=A0AB39L2B4_9MICC